MSHLLQYNPLTGTYDEIDIPGPEIGGLDPEELSTDVHGSPSKSPPVNADEFMLLDSASAFSIAKLTWANLKAALNSVYAAATHSHAASDITSGTIAQARLGTGSGGAGTKVLYDDQTYKVPAAGGGGSSTRSMLLMGG